nr:glycosyltransferase [Collinsella intestinalis]
MGREAPADTAGLARVAVLIPCYNEALTVGKVIDVFRAALPGATIYVYDNNSTDDTAAIAREHGAVVRFEPRQGKAMWCARCFATSRPTATSWSTATTPTPPSRRSSSAGPSSRARPT